MNAERLFFRGRTELARKAAQARRKQVRSPSVRWADTCRSGSPSSKHRIRAAPFSPFAIAAAIVLFSCYIGRKSDAKMNVPTTDTLGTLIYKEAMAREKKALMAWEYKYGALTGTSMDLEKKLGRLHVDVQRGRHFHALDSGGSAGSYVSLHINSAAPARTAAVRAPEPVWNERLPLECTLSDTLRVEAREEAGGDGVESALLGAAEVPLRDLATGKQLTKVVKLAGGPGSPTVTLVLAWRAKPGSSLSAHDSTMRVSLAQCRHELAISRAEKAAWENASGYLRSYGLNAPAEARNGRLDGPAAAEVLPNARPPSGKPRREGIVPLAEMVVRPDVAAAVAEAQGRAAPPEEEKALSPFQKKWKAVDAELEAKKEVASRGYPVAPDGCSQPALFGGYKRRATRFF